MSKAITMDSFEENVVASKVPVLVDFWAPWCQPCTMLGPLLDELAESYAGRITVAKVNVDEEPDLAQRFDITAIPALLVYKNGEVVRKQIGALPKPQLEALFKDVLGYLC